jgi:hypothetical protein
MTLAAIVTVLWGFAPTYYMRPVLHITRYPTGKPVSPYLPALVHVHAIVFSAWLVLLLVQTTLIASGRIRVHRRLGYAGVVLAVAVVVLGIATAIRGGRDGWAPGGPYPDALGFMIVGLGDIAVFTTFIALGLVYRSRPALHKRFMILGTVGGLMWPAITRMPGVAGRPALMFALLLALVFAWAVRDLMVDRRQLPLSLGCGLAILATFPLRVAIGQTAAWHRLAEWLIR